MIVECPGCRTIFPVDPKKIPDGGVSARCSKCSEVFFVDKPEPEAEVTEPSVREAEPAAEPPAVEEAPPAAEPPPVEEAAAVPPDLPEATPVTPRPEEDIVKEDVVGPEVAFEASPEMQEEPEPEGEPLAEAASAVEAAAADVTAEIDSATEEAPPPTPSFGKRDPSEKARRLARVLVSDIILYNPDRHHQATGSGRIKEEFEEEIQKSWNEYVEQVGEEVAKSTTFFTDALNEILAKGEEIF